MKLAILIMAHRLPEQLAILCNLIFHKNIDVYVHVDKKMDINLFENKITNPSVRFIQNRTETNWGGFSIIDTIIRSYDEIINCGEYDYICNISGQDLPIKKTSELIDFLEVNHGNEFIENIIFSEDHAWWKENRRRVEKYSFVNHKFTGKYRIEQIVNAFTLKRKSPHNFIFSGNSGWFCLSREAVKYILHSYENDKHLVDFFKYVWGADEIYFSTVLNNSKFREKMVGNLVLTVWQENNKLHPKIFTIEDKEQLHNSNKFFARKFDYTYDDKIISHFQNVLSQEIRNKEHLC